MQKKQEQLEILQNVHDSMTEALKQVVNEPSVGLYFIQQHVHKAVPAVLSLNAQLEEMTGDAELATADANDCLSSLRTMKECGPFVIEHMSKMLESASDTIPVRHMRGSVSQLLPKPVRPSGVGRGPWRSSSFRRQTETSKNSAQAPFGDFQKDPVFGTLNDHQFLSGPSEAGHTLEGPEKRSTTSFVPDSIDSGHPAVERLLSPSQRDMYTSVGDDGSVSRGSMKDELGGNPSHYMRAVLDSAFSKAETVSREGAKLLRRGAENESGNGRLKSLLGFGRKGPKILEGDNVNLQRNEGGMSTKNSGQEEDNLEQFQAEHAAKLEMWLSESDGDSLPVS